MTLLLQNLKYGQKDICQHAVIYCPETDPQALEAGSNSNASFPIGAKEIFGSVEPVPDPALKKKKSSIKFKFKALPPLFVARKKILVLDLRTCLHFEQGGIFLINSKCTFKRKYQ